MPLIISKNGSESKTIQHAIFPSEDYLQKYIRDNPNCLPIKETKGAAKFLPLAREFPTESGPIDVLGVDEKGEIYIVEVKLEKNADKRKVVSQALDYGASIWKSYEDYDDFISDIERCAGKPVRDSLKEVFGENEVDGIISNIKESVRTGRINFVVVMDAIEDRLKQLISFLNENSNFSLFAVEFEYYNYENLEIIYPRTYGAEIKKDRTTTRGAPKNWDEASFFEEAKSKLNLVDFERLRAFYEACVSILKIEWGKGAIYGTFQLKIDVDSKTMTLATVKSAATGWMGLGKLLELGASPSAVKEFIRDLRSIGFAFEEEDGKARKSPEFDIESLTDESKLTKFKDAVTKLKNAVAKTSR
jgi:hypothetical protein